jgi:hypothetical protein
VALNPLAWLTWRKPEGVTLDRDYEREIVRTALRAHRANDPEAAWFVAHYARDRLRLTWLWVAMIVFFTAELVWGGISGSFQWWHLLVVVAILWLVWFLYAHRRALRLNEPAATVPPGLEEQG